MKLKSIFFLFSLMCFLFILDGCSKKPGKDELLAGQNDLLKWIESKDAEDFFMATFRDRDVIPIDDAMMNKSLEFFTPHGILTKKTVDSLNQVYKDDPEIKALNEKAHLALSKLIAVVTKKALIKAYVNATNNMTKWMESDEGPRELVESAVAIGNDFQGAFYAKMLAFYQAEGLSNSDVTNVQSNYKEDPDYQKAEERWALASKNFWGIVKTALM